MFENVFSSSIATWAGLVGAMVAIPILIHLINLVRHQTVKWAAMDFLLKSHKKHRNWVWLKQFLLLLARVVALLLALLLFAQVGCQDNRVAQILGSATTHHYVLLDDSFSMEDRDGNGRAFDRATATLSQIAARARNRQSQKFTILRYSAGIKLKDFSDAESAQDLMVSADINSELVDTRFDERVESLKGNLTPSQLAVDVQASLSIVTQLIESRTDENAIVYLLSDFRKRNWDSSSETEALIRRIESTGGAVELIDCAPVEHSNLSIQRLSPVGNVRVAGTPLMMEVEVANLSDSKVSNVQVQLETWEYGKAKFDGRPERLKIQTKPLPTVFIESIDPGESSVQAFPIFFDSTGSHTVRATLEDNFVLADNVRYCSVPFASSAKVLLVDSEQQTESRWLSLVLNPGGTTGVDPVTVTSAFLRDSTPEQLDAYDVVFLLDIGRLDDLAVKNLEAFVRRGGGAIFFLGSNTSSAFYQEQLYRDGKGLFPVRIDQPFNVPERTEDTPDIVPVQHPIFAPAMSVKNSLLDLVQVRKLWKPDLRWLAEQETSDAATARDIANRPRVLATIRGMNSLPLVVEQSFGQGRVMAVMTTAGPAWNNWMRNATFLPIMLLMEDYLAAGRYPMTGQPVGTRVALERSAAQFQRDAKQMFRDGVESTTASESLELPMNVGQSQYEFRSPTSERSGVQEIWFKPTEGDVRVERVDFNVDPLESDLDKLSSQQLAAKLASTKVTMVNWDQFNPEPTTAPIGSISQLLLFALVFIMIAEQCLAYMTNYHRR